MMLHEHFHSSRASSKECVRPAITGVAEESKPLVLGNHTKAKKGNAKEISDEIYQTLEVQTPVVVTTPQAFIFQPESWEIPTHESRFVNIYFNPTEIKSYRSLFMAEIDDEGITLSVAPKVSNSGKMLTTFDLGDTRTLPCLSIEQPTTRDGDGNISIDFSKVLLERSIRKKFLLRDDGVMPKETKIFI